MNFFILLGEFFNELANYCYDIAWECWGSWYVPNVIGDLFVQLQYLFLNISWYCFEGADWWDYVMGWLGYILRWNTIWSYILSYVPNLIQIRDWFYDWSGHVWGIIYEFWDAAYDVVVSLINAAGQILQSQINSLNSWAASIQALVNDLLAQLPDITAILSWFSAWTGHVLSLVNTWWNDRLLDVQGLINSAFLARQSLWAGWQDWRGQVIEFFTDPVDYIWERFTDWFLGPEG